MSQQRKTAKSEQIIHGMSSTIPGEIVEDILSRLPVKSLLRFRSVSKPWNYLLSSNKFIKTHVKKSATNTTLAHARFPPVPDKKDRAYCSLSLCSTRSLFCETRDTVSVEYQLDYPVTFYTSPRTRIAGYSNGLCCIKEDAEGFILWNPSTRKYQKLPPVYEEEFLWIDGKGGFGFDESSDDYKVLAIVRTRCPGGGCCSFNFIFRLYSLSTNSWKTLEDLYSYGALNGPLVLVNSKFHWAARVGAFDGIRLDIVSFDLGSDAVGSVEPPSSVKGYYLCPELSVLEGCLCVLCGNTKQGTDVWVMKEYGVKESWCKLMTVAAIAGVHTYGYPYQTFTPLCVSPEGEILLLEGSSLYIYNPKHNSFRHPEMNNTGFDQIGFFQESLVSPFPDGERVQQSIE